jgi:hypothetical protein
MRSEEVGVEVLDRPKGYSAAVEEVHSRTGTNVALSSTREVTSGTARLRAETMNTSTERQGGHRTSSWDLGGLVAWFGSWRRRRSRPANDGVLGRQETSLLIDKLARRDFGLSGDEFLQRATHGEIPDTSAAHAIMMLAGEPPR